MGPPLRFTSRMPVLHSFGRRAVGRYVPSLALRALLVRCAGARVYSVIAGSAEMAERSRPSAAERMLVLASKTRLKNVSLAGTFVVY